MEIQTQFGSALPKVMMLRSLPVRHPWSSISCSTGQEEVYRGSRKSTHGNNSGGSSRIMRKTGPQCMYLCCWNDPQSSPLGLDLVKKRNKVLTNMWKTRCLMGKVQGKIIVKRGRIIEVSGKYVDPRSILCLVRTQWENQMSTLNRCSHASRTYLILVLFFIDTFRHLAISYITSNSATASQVVSAVTDDVQPCSFSDGVACLH